MKTRLLILCGVLICSLGHGAELRKVIGINEPAPGFEAGAVLERLGDTPRIDAAGTVSVVAIVRRPSGVRTVALYRIADSSPALLFSTGDVAPGSGNLVFAAFPFFPQTPRIDAGRVTFVAEAQAAGSQNPIAGIWSDRFGSFARLFLLGDDMPNLPAGAGPLVSFSMTTRGGNVFLRGQFPRDSQILRDDEGLWRNATGAWLPVIVKGQGTPGFAGTVFDGDTPLGTFFFFTARGDGRVLVQAWIKGPNVNRDNDEGLWVETGAGLQLFVREGAAVQVPVQSTSGNKPTRTRRATFGPTDSGIPTFGSDNENLVPAINDSGAVLFGAVLRFGKERSGSVWTNRAGSLQLLALGTLGLVGSGPGSQAPGLPSGVTFATFSLGRINASGRIAFLGTFNEPGAVFDLRQGLWWDAPGSLQLVAAQNRPLAAIPGASVAQIVLVDRLTNSGSLVFDTVLAGPGIDGSNHRAVVQASAAGVLPVLRTGDTVLTASGTRTVAGFSWGLGATSENEGVATIAFTDGSAGVFAFPLH